jgi:hypothetical protein
MSEGQKQLIPTGGNNVMDTSKLSGLLNQAMGMDSSESETVATPDPVIAQPTTTLETPQYQQQEPIQAETAVEEKIFELPDNARVKVKIDGKEEVVEYNNFKDSLQREAMFTKRQQTLASQRKQAENELAQMYAQLQIQAQVLQAQAQSQQRQPSVVEQLQELANLQNVKQPKPDELVAHGELQTAIQQALKQLEQQQQTNRTEVEQGVEARIQQLVQGIQVKQEQDRFTQSIHQVLGDKESQILARVVPSPEYAEAIVRHNVARMGAQSVDQGIEFAKLFVKDWVGQVKKETLGERQAESAAKARQVLEPSGSGPAPALANTNKQPTIFKKDGSIDWNGLGARAHALAASLEA